MRRSAASYPTGLAAMADYALVRLFWRLLDALDCWVTHARLSLVDAVRGPEPETAADQQRKRDRERLQRAFPETDGEGAGAVIYVTRIASTDD
jgi:hypothetical protein